MRQVFGRSDDTQAAAIAVRDSAGRIADLDALRGIAIALVVIAHVPNTLIWPAPAWMDWVGPRFSVGVDLFFAISGYVIGRSLWRDMKLAAAAGERWAAIWQFWLRRAWRLLPAAYLWLAIPCLFSVYFNASGWFDTPGNTAVAAAAAVFDVENLLLVYRRHHQLAVGPFFHYWSLSLEEQFYFVIPFCILLRRRWLILGFLVTSPAILLLTDAYEGAFRLEGFLGGVLIALFEPDMRAFWRRLPQTARIRLGSCMLSAVTLVALLTLAGLEAALIDRGVAGLWVSRVGVGLLAMLLVFVASADRGLLLGRGPLYRASLWLGQRSYSVYLVHCCAFTSAKELLFRLAPSRTPEQMMLFVIPLGLALLAAFTWVTYSYVELPTRSRRPVRPAATVDVAP